MKKLTIVEMILIGLFALEKSRKSATFENLVGECFKLFPEAFGLVYFPNCPDTLKFDRTLRKLKEKGLIEGHIRSTFRFTEKGNKFVKIITPVGKHLPSWSRAPEKRLIEEIKLLSAYKKYRENGRIPSEIVIKDFLHLSAEASPNIVDRSLRRVVNFAEQLGEKEFKKFIIACQNFLKRGS